MLEPHTVSELCRLAGFGVLEGPPEPVEGGLLHRVYRVRAEGGDFAVKAISPIVAAYDGVRERMRRAERVASAVTASGLPAVPALEIAGDTLNELGGTLLLAYPWVEGRALPSGPAGPQVGTVVGDLIGRVHALRLPFEAERPEEGEPPPDPWDVLLEEADAQGAAWAGELRAALPELRAWRGTDQGARRELWEGRLAVGHRDLDQKNLLWSEDGLPWMIDWESAGPLPPAKEIVTAAADWSGQGEDAATFAAVLRAYRVRAELTTDEARLGLRTCLSVGWLEFSARRALGLAGADTRDREIGRQEVPRTLRSLQAFAERLDGLDRACG